MLMQTVPIFEINNRRYLGSKFKLLKFLGNIIDKYCLNAHSFCDLFAGTGVVAHYFNSRFSVITNDILQSNVYSHTAFLGKGEFSYSKLSAIIAQYNYLSTENLSENYYSENFADTFLSRKNLKKVGFIRQDIDKKYVNKAINDKEKAILITSLLYAVDKIANTVGHYDAYRMNGELDKPLVLGLPAIDNANNQNNQIFNEDAGLLVKKISADIVYLDPPYNSRQYCDAYHFLENLAVNLQPNVVGVARKMDRSHLKSQYCTAKALIAFEELIENIDANYILFSYNSTGNKANSRSNAKLSDDDILRVLGKKGEVTIEEQTFKAFSTGKSDIQGLTERVFVCITHKATKQKKPAKSNSLINNPVILQENIQSPLNYTGGKFKLLNQIQPLLPNNEVYFYDVFCGGANVGVNANANYITCIDNNAYVIELFNTLSNRSFEDVLSVIETNIRKYNLSDTYRYGYDYYGCNSDNGVGGFNKDKFLLARADFNCNKDILLFLTLILFSFNNQFRFNLKGEFNIPVGKRDFNHAMRKKLKFFMEKIQRKPISFIQQDFRQLDLDKIKSQNALVYLDPPYILGTATYNENNGWTPKDEQDLLALLTQCNNMNIRFALSNVMEHKGNHHRLLHDWVQSLDLTQHNLVKGYGNASYQAKSKYNSKTITQEVLITNF